MISDHARQQPMLLTAGLLLGSFLVLLSVTSVLHMQPDETLTYVTTNRAFPDMVRFTLFEDVHAPLWFMLAWAWQQFAGLTEFAGRIQSALIALLTLSVVYQIGRTEFRQPESGWFALALLGSNAYFLVYTLEIRPYPLVMLAAALSYRFFLAWLSKRTLHSALFYGLTLSLLLYTHYYLVFVLLSQVIYFALFRLRTVSLWVQGLSAGLLAALLLIPQVIVLLHQLNLIRFTQGGTQGVPTLPTNADTLADLIALASNGWWLIVLVILLAGLVRLWKHPAWQVSLAWLLIAPGLLLLANLRTPLLTMRYLSYMAPALSLVTGFALAAWLPRTKHWRRIALWGVLIAVCALNLYALPSFIPARIPFRDLFAEVNRLMEPGDVLLIQPRQQDYFLDDQYARYLAPQLRAQQILDSTTAQAARRVWFISHDIFSDDYDRIFEQLENTHRVETVIGDCTRAWCYVIQSMLAAPLREAVYFGETIGFLGADIEPFENQQIPVLLWWEVATVPQADYSISLQLLAADGNLITQVDRQIKPPDADEIPTSAMQPGSSYLDWRVLEIPAGLPAGTYRLQVVVYQWWDGQRLLLADGGDSYVIDTLEISGE